jgi:ComF family protein
MIKSTKTFSKKLLNLILPARCISCKNIILDENPGICHDCWKNLIFITDPLCSICGDPFEFSFEENKKDMVCAKCLAEKPKYKKLRATFKYNDKSKHIILALKYGDRTDSAKVLSSFLQKTGKEFINDIDYIIPVPLHRLRLLKRKYNQAGLLAKNLADNLPKAKYIPDALIRKKHTKPQGHYTKNKREQNLKNAFVANPKYKEFFEKKNILIIDDVITTGSTVNECTKALLKQNKDANIYILGLAKVIF